MPIKKHVLKVGKDNTVMLPKSLCDSLGIAEGCVVRMYSNKTGYQCILEVPLSYENACWIEQYKLENAQLREQIKELQKNNGNV